MMFQNDCCSLVDTCWERANLLALLYVMFYGGFLCVFSHFLIWWPGSEGVVPECIDS